MKLRATLISISMALGLAGCADNSQVTGKRDLGEFRLGHNVVVADNAVQGGFLSREATPERIEEVLTSEMERRLGRYEGGQLYHVGINVDGYVLAQPGIPVVAAPKSLMIVSVNVWDDAGQKKLTEKPRQITIWETLKASSVVGGTGYTMTADEQLINLSQNVVREIEDWFEVRNTWFDAKPGLEDELRDVVADEATQEEGAAALAAVSEAAPVVEGPAEPASVAAQPRPEKSPEAGPLPL